MSSIAEVTDFCGLRRAGWGALAVGSEKAFDEFVMAVVVTGALLYPLIWCFAYYRHDALKAGCLRHNYQFYRIALHASQVFLDLSYRIGVEGLR